MEERVDLWWSGSLIGGVEGPRGAEVLRDLEAERLADAVVPRLGDQPRRALDPARLEAERHTGIGGQAGDVDLRPIGPVVSMAIRDEVQLATAHKARRMRALAEPAVGPGSGRRLHGAIDDQVCPGSPLAEGDVLDDRITIVSQVQVQFLVIRHTPQRVQLSVGVGDRVSLEGSLAAFVTVPPGGRQVIVERGMPQFQTAATAVGKLGPVAAERVIHGIDQIVVLIDQPDQLAPIGQTPLKIAHHRKVAINRAQSGGIGGADEVTAGGDDGADGKREVRSIGEPPAGDIHRGVAAVVELDELTVELVRGWVGT